MGIFRQRVEVGAAAEGPFEFLEAVVDAGAFYTWVPRSVLHRLGIAPHGRRASVLADGTIVGRDVGRAWLRVDGQMEVTLVVFGDEGTEALLGAYTLEGLALAADPVNQRLVPLPRLFLLGLGDGGGSLACCLPLLGAGHDGQRARAKKAC